MSSRIVPKPYFSVNCTLDKPEILNNVRVVLSHTTHPGNIGAAARAMKTMGLQSLYLINPQRFPDQQADAMAASAADVLQNAVVCGSLDEALQGAVLVAGMSARVRYISQEVFTQRANSLLVKPDISVPNRSATGCCVACCTISGIAARGVNTSCEI